MARTARKTRPAPAPVEIPAPPRPLLRTSVTLTPPWDTDWGPPAPVTVEVVILAADAPEGDVSTVTADALPELQLAGWRGWRLGVLDIYTRAMM